MSACRVTVRSALYDGSQRFTEVASIMTASGSVIDARVALGVVVEVLAPELRRRGDGRGGRTSPLLEFGDRLLRPRELPLESAHRGRGSWQHRGLAQRGELRRESTFEVLDDVVDLGGGVEGSRAGVRPKLGPILDESAQIDMSGSVESPQDLTPDRAERGRRHGEEIEQCLVGRAESAGQPTKV